MPQSIDAALWRRCSMCSGPKVQFVGLPPLQKDSGPRTCAAEKEPGSAAAPGAQSSSGVRTCAASRAELRHIPKEKNSYYINLLCVAERQGFEPSIRLVALTVGNVGMILADFWRENCF